MFYLNHFRKSSFTIAFIVAACSILMANYKGDKSLNHPSVNGSFNAVKDSSKHIYLFDQPDEVFVLGTQLSEISGLAYHTELDQLYAVNDEQGRYFVIDKNNGELLARQKFHKKADYEGIELIDNEVIIVKNTGTVLFYNTQKDNLRQFKTKLNATNDVEGLCYDKADRILLLACKGQNTDGLRDKTIKSVYGFSLDSMKLIDQPVLDIYYDELIEYLASELDHMNKIQKIKFQNRAKSFSPSGIAIHPLNQHLYILSAKGSILLILDEKYNIHHIEYLNAKTIPQPEGICFDSDANLYISTEGQGFSGKIFKYNFQNGN